MTSRMEMFFTRGGGEKTHRQYPRGDIKNRSGPQQKDLRAPDLYVVQEKSTHIKSFGVGS